VRVVVVDPTVDRRFLGSVAEAVVPGARVDAVLGTPVVVPGFGAGVAREDVVAGVVLVAGLRADAVVPAGVRVAVGLAGLDMMLLVRRAAVAEAAGLRSSSLALTLGRLRWVEVVDVAVVGRRAAIVDVVGGRVGGLLRPPVARAVAVVPAVLDGVVVEVPGRRTVLVVVPAGRLTAEVVVGLASPLALAAGLGASDALASGDEGIGVASLSSFGTSEADSTAVSSGCSSCSSSSWGSCSSALGTSTFSMSAIVKGSEGS
jgi:hypothetical protein